MKKEDTISAVATALGESSIGIIRISGDEAISVADRVFKSKNGKRLYEIGSYRAIYGNIESSQERKKRSPAIKPDSGNPTFSIKTIYTPQR